MNVNFTIDSDNIPSQVSIPRQNFPDGIIPPVITVTNSERHHDGRPVISTHGATQTPPLSSTPTSTSTRMTGGRSGWTLAYRYSNSVDNNGNYIYNLIRVVGAGRRKKKKTCPPICVFGNAHGGGQTPCGSPNTEHELVHGIGGQVGHLPYSNQLGASGGTAPYTFTLTSGSLPTNYTLSPTGLISGDTTAIGALPFTITATDANGCSGSQKFILIIDPI